jgi:hypothetical protein
LLRYILISGWILLIDRASAQQIIHYFPRGLPDGYIWSVTGALGKQGKYKISGTVKIRPNGRVMDKNGTDVTRPLDCKMYEMTVSFEKFTASRY